jgi:hypothetical protein
MGNTESCFCYYQIKKKDRDFLIMAPEVKNQLMCLLKLQAIWRGYFYRKNIVNIRCKANINLEENKENNDLFIIKSNNDLNIQLSLIKNDSFNLKEIDNYTPKLSQKVMEVEKNLGEFIIEEKEYSLINNEVLIKRKAIFIEDEKAFYVGTWNINNTMEGYGTMYLLDGGKKEGFFLNNKMHFRGRMISFLGDFFEGEILENKAQGSGKYVSSKGIIYIGKWENDKQNGLGEEIYPDGSRYEGNFENGSKHGKGKFIWKDGAEYEGDVVMNVLEGFGTHKWKDGRVYKGTWKNNKMDGKGLFIWPDQKKYIGQYSNDKKSGYGTFIWPDCKKYEGTWFNGKQNGYGILTSKGEKKYGEWKNGKKVRWIDDENMSNFQEIFDKIYQNFSENTKFDLCKEVNV